MKLYPRVGRLNPAGLEKISRCDDYEQLRSVVETYGVCFCFSRHHYSRILLTLIGLFHVIFYRFRYGWS
jgi:hypothetical protein